MNTVPKAKTPRVTVDEAAHQALELVERHDIRAQLATEIVGEWMRHPSQGVDAAARRLFARWHAMRPDESPEHVLHRQLALVQEDAENTNAFIQAASTGEEVSNVSLVECPRCRQWRDPSREPNCPCR